MTVQQVENDGAGAGKRINVIQGEYHVTQDPDAILTTLLGSCVAACMRDPVAGVGGLNHFLLPGETHTHGGDGLRYGVHAMELLVNGILRLGGRRERLELMLFGGARMTEAFADVGGMNADFAERFAKQEGIPVKAASLRGDRGRRIQFWPVSGRVRQLVLHKGAAAPAPVVVPPPSADSGSLELF